MSRGTVAYLVGGPAHGDIVTLPDERREFYVPAFSVDRHPIDRRTAMEVPVQKHVYHRLTPVTRTDRDGWVYEHGGVV